MMRTVCTLQSFVAVAAAGMLLQLAAPAVLAQPTQGVSKDEIVIGTIQDLSGPVAGLRQGRRATACSCAWTRSTSRAASTAARSG